MSNRRYFILACTLIIILFLAACSAPAHQTTTFTPATTLTVPQASTATAATPTTTIQTNIPLDVYFIDVGQGDCEIVRCQDKTMLIDAGTNASATSLVHTIKNMGISKFDVAIGTHPHEDHIGGLDAVINNFSIGTLYMPKATANTKTFTDVLTAIKNKGYTVTTPVPGSTFNIGDARCTILAPNSQTYDDLNNYSIVIKLEYGNTSFLFTGDAQALSEQEMLAKGFNLKANVLKVGHHGSDSSTTVQFLQAVSPQFGIIEVGAGNDYGHPHQVTLDKLAAANVKVYRTDLNGTIIIRSDGVTLTVSTSK
jgi:competence protein ComEC